jgi:hypothetical protein
MISALLDEAFWRNRRVLITGHTGFKGGWLSVWLQSLDSSVYGLSLGVPTEPSLYDLARVTDGMSGENAGRHPPSAGRADRVTRRRVRSPVGDEVPDRLVIGVDELGAGVGADAVDVEDAHPRAGDQQVVDLLR